LGKKFAFLLIAAHFYYRKVKMGMLLELLSLTDLPSKKGRYSRRFRIEIISTSIRIISSFSMPLLSQKKDEIDD
jgi:hypothetical protein